MRAGRNLSGGFCLRLGIGRARERPPEKPQVMTGNMSPVITWGDLMWGVLPQALPRGSGSRVVKAQSLPQASFTRRRRSQGLAQART